MTTPAPAEPGYRRDHACQTLGCPNDFSIITIRVDDSETMMLCEGCNLSFNLAVLQRLSEQGLLPGLDTPPETVDGQATTPVV